MVTNMDTQLKTCAVSILGSHVDSTNIILPERAELSSELLEEC